MVTEPPDPRIPPRPVMPPEAAAYPKLQKVKTALDKHSHLIFEAEHEKIQRYKEKADRQNASQPYRSRDKWAR